MVGTVQRACPVMSFFRFGSKEAATAFAESLTREGWQSVRIVADSGSGVPPDWIVEGREPTYREKQSYGQTSYRSEATKKNRT